MRGMLGLIELAIAPCARVAGEPAMTDMVFILWPNRIEPREKADAE